MTSKSLSATAALSATDSALPSRRVCLLALIFLALLWLQMFLALTYNWANGKYYHYGWVVPLLAGFCFWRRWQLVNAGEQHPGKETASADPTSPQQGLLRSPITLAIGTAGLLVAITLLRILELSDPGWRVPLWIHAFALTAYSIWIMIVVLGAPRAKQFFFVAVLALTAVPLPSMLEMGLVDRLSQWVLEAAALLLGLIGNASGISGSMLIVEGQQLEVDQTCSGIRSFQSLFMYAIFFGEFWRLNLLGRISLLALGLALAIITNVTRVVVLTKIFLADGQTGFDAAHDWVGYAAFLVATGGLLLAGRYLEGNSQPEDR